MPDVPGLDDHLDWREEPESYGPEPCDPAGGNDPDWEDD